MAHGRKTGGRTAGTANKFTQEMRDRLQTIFDQYAEGQLHLDLQATEPDTRLRFMLEVAKLITPKPPTIAGFDQQEQPIFAGINLEVEDKPFPAPIIVMVKDMGQPDPEPMPQQLGTPNRDRTSAM